MTLYARLVPAAVRLRLRPHLQRALEVSGLIGVLHRRQERRLAQAPASPFDDGLPMPPAELLVLVGASSDGRWFSEGGREHAAMFSSLAGKHGVDVAKAADVWDLGCGCGRIARWLAPQVIAGGGAFTGSDINRRLVDWTSAHLPGRYLLNGLKTPTSLAPKSKDLVYAYSVLTHLREKAVRAWLEEVHRVLRPGGLALLTFHDEGYAGAWGPPGVVGRLEREPFIVLNDAMEGSNYLSSWTTAEHLKALAGPLFEVLEIVPGRADNPTQAVAVLRARRS